MAGEYKINEKWYRMLTEGDSEIRRFRHILGMIPSSPRCKVCNAPFKGVGGTLMHVLGRDQSRYNPRYCEPCSQFENPGGAEVILTMLFADVRGSTTLAETMSPLEFSQLINRFYAVATDVLVRTDAMVDRLVGDEVIGLYLPGMAGQEHSRKAIQAAQNLLRKTGHRDRKGPWIPVGVGVHTGIAYVGVVGGGEEGPTDFTALGDNVNITARLASNAAQGEVIASEAVFEAAQLEPEGLEKRQLELKGKSEPVTVRVLHAR